jgi:uncharacterized membrane protein YfcA
LSEALSAVLAVLVPPELSVGLALLLVALSFVTSALTGALGLGGGILMLAVLATFLAPATVIPVHGVVQIGSNLGRAALMRGSIARPLLVPFALGSLAGAGLGALVVTELPRGLLRLILALFVLWSCWGPGLRPARLPPRAFALVGAATSFVTMFIGATGAFVAAFLDPERLTRHQVVATHAACMTVQHGFKVAAFTALGFPFLPWLPLLALMIGLGFLGTLAGKRLLDRLPDAAFARAFRIVLTALALKLLWDAVASGSGAV